MSALGGRRAIRLAIVAPALLVAGCDKFYGIESKATLPGAVDIRCVNAALASVPGVDHVTYQRSENRATEILPKQREVLTVMHTWGYGEGGSDILQINQTLDGWDYRNGRSRLGVVVPSDEIARFQPLMLKVNRAIQSRCGLPVGNLKAEPVGETQAQKP